MSRRRSRNLLILSLAGAVVALVAGLGLFRRRPGPTTASAPRRPAHPATVVEPEATPDTALEGVVLDPDGRPLPGATVTTLLRRAPDDPKLWSPPSARATTSDQHGRFRVDGLVPGTHAVTASAPVATAAVVPAVSVEAGKTTSGVELRLGGAGVLVDVHVRESGGGPIPGAHVLAIHWLSEPVFGSPPETVAFEARTDDAGAHRLRLPKGRLSIGASADGYATREEFLEVAADTTVDVRLEPAARIRGVVVSAEGRAPVADAEVSARPVGRGFVRVDPVRTDEQGRFELTTLPAGSYRLVARAGALVGGTAAPVLVTVGAPADAVELIVKPGAKLTGTVTAGDGQPIAKAFVEAEPMDDRGPPLRRRERTDERGRYAVDGLEPGRYRVSAGGEGWESSFVDLPMAAGTTTRDFRLRRGLLVTGVVLTSSGAPSAGAELDAVALTRTLGGMGAADRAKTDANGGFELKRLVAGELTIRVHDASEAATFGPEKIAHGDDRRITIKLAAGARVAGTVTWDDGTPAADIKVNGVPRGMGVPNPVSTRTGKDGSFELGPLQAGAVSVVAMAPRESIAWGSDRPEQAELTVAAGERKTGVKLVVRRRNETIGGTVVDGAGRPVDGAVISAAADREGRAWKGAAQEHAVSAPDGSFTIEALAKGTYTLWAEHPQHAETERTGVETGTKGLRLELAAAGSLAGVVVDGSGVPVTTYVINAVRVKPGEPAVARLARGRETPPVHVDDPRGVFKLDHLAAGRYDVVATSSAGATARAAGVALAAGEAKQGLRLTVATGVTVTGRVADYETGQPIEGVVVEASGVPGDDRGAATTDAQGAFTLADVPALPTAQITFEAPENRYVYELRPVPAGRDGRADLGIVRMLKTDPKRPFRGRVGIQYGADRDGKVVVRDLVPDLPAAKAGVRKGDAIVKIDGAEVGDFSDVARALTGADLDKTTTVTVQSPGEPPREVKLKRSP